jgi:uncharacterized membrane protein
MNSKAELRVVFKEGFMSKGRRFDSLAIRLKLLGWFILVVTGIAALTPQQAFAQG